MSEAMLTATRSSSGMRWWNSMPLLMKCLHELEAHAAARQVLVRISVVKPLGVQYGHGRRQHLVGHVVVADDEVDALLAGIGDFLYRLDAAIQHDDQLHARLGGIVHSLHRHAVTFVVSVGDVVINVRVILLDEFIDQRHGRRAVHVIVSVNQYPFFSAHRPVEAFHCHIHVFHQEGVVQVGQLGSEELPCGLYRGDTSFYQQSAQYGTDAQSLRQLSACFCLFGGNGQVIPFVSHYIYCFFFFLSPCVGNARAACP